MPQFERDSIIKGLPLSKGLAMARVCLFNEQRHSNLPMYKVEGEGIAREQARLTRALELAARRVDKLHEDVAARIGRAEAEIFTVQRMILEDESMVRQIRDLIDAGDNAESAVAAVLDTHEARLQEVDNAHLRERASDFGEIKRRLLDVLGNMKPELQCVGQDHCEHGRNRIVVAEELTPTLTVELDIHGTRGFVTERGGKNSHAAILARALGIPAVSGIKGIHGFASCGTEVLVDGHSGEVVIAPSEETRRQFEARHQGELATRDPVDPVPGLRVMANISLGSDVHDAVMMRAEGIGLFRTEFEFMAAGRVLSEEEQYRCYAQVLERMQGAPVTFRLMDVGADKPFAFMPMPQEDNPALGCRGARFLLEHHELLRTQARALARAATHGPVRILYPMITGTVQYRKVHGLFMEAVDNIPAADMQHGIMFEIPSACLEAEGLFEVVDFASVGTNDLVQYLFAVDRDNDLVAYDYNPDQPVFWALLGRLAAAARAAGKPLSVCGELAARIDYLPKMVGAGIERVSVSSRLIPDVRMALTQYREQAGATAEDVRQAATVG
jgi:phosphotransferase system enzyme I (PtsI)